VGATAKQTAQIVDPSQTLYARSHSSCWVRATRCCRSTALLCTLDDTTRVANTRTASVPPTPAPVRGMLGLPGSDSGTLLLQSNLSTQYQSVNKGAVGRVQAATLHAVFVFATTLAGLALQNKGPWDNCCSLPAQSLLLPASLCVAAHLLKAASAASTMAVKGMIEGHATDTKVGCQEEWSITQLGHVLDTSSCMLLCDLLHTDTYQMLWLAG
jgi:hypothetical protein